MDDILSGRRNSSSSDAWFVAFIAAWRLGDWWYCNTLLLCFFISSFLSTHFLVIVERLGFSWVLDIVTFFFNLTINKFFFSTRYYKFLNLLKLSLLNLLYFTLKKTRRNSIYKTLSIIIQKIAVLLGLNCICEETVVLNIYFPTIISASSHFLRIS